MQVYPTIKNRSGKNGLCPIYIVIAGSRSQRKLIPTGIRIDPKEWHANKRIVRRSHPNSVELNDQLNQKRSEIDLKLKEIKSQQPYITWEGMIEMYSRPKEAPKVNQQLDFWDAFEEHAGRMEGKVRIDTIKDFKSLKKHLNSFEKKFRMNIRWEDMTFAFYERFSTFLETEVVKPNGEIGLAKNSAGKQIKNLKTFLRKSMRRGHCDHINLEGWKVETETADHVYISEEELKIIWAKDLSDQPELEKIRDLFIVGCETGLRISDFTSDLSFAINQKVIRYTVQKTHQKVTIPITERLQEVLDKYDGRFPTIKKYLFNKRIKEVIRICDITEKIQRRRTKGGEKENEWIEKWKLVSSHTCRRSFCTNMYKKGIPSPIIRQVSGHTTDKALMKYVRVNANEVAEFLLSQVQK